MKFKDRSISVPLLVCVLAGLVVGGVMSARPAYNSYKRWRALKLVAQARTQYLPARNWSAMDHTLRLANGFAPTEPEVLRICAEYLALGNNENALIYYGNLVESGHATAADRWGYARQALLHNRPDIARQQSGVILKLVPLERDALLLGIEALLKLGVAEDAYQLAEIGYQAHPSDDELALQFGVLQVNRTDPSQQAAGRRILWGLAMSQAPQRHRAIERLAQNPTLSRTELTLLARILEQVPTRTLTQELTWLGLRHRLAAESERAELNSACVRLVSKASEIGERVQLADWLLGHGAPDRVPEVITVEQCQQNANAAQRWLQGKADEGKWSEVASFIDDPTFSIAPPLRSCFRAQVSYRQGDTNATIAYLKQAVSQVGHDPNHLSVIAGYAERLGHPKIAAEALERLLSNPLQADRAAQDIVRLLTPSDDVQDLLATLRRMQQFRPKDQGVADLICWFELLLRQRIGPNADAARERFQKAPNNHRFRLTLALAELRLDNPDAALAHLEQQPIDPTNSPVRVRLLYAAALGSAGQRILAQQVAKNLDVTRLKPEEVDLIRPWRESTGSETPR